MPLSFRTGMIQSNDGKIMVWCERDESKGGLLGERGEVRFLKVQESLDKKKKKGSLKINSSSWEATDARPPAGRGVGWPPACYAFEAASRPY